MIKLILFFFFLVMTAQIDADHVKRKQYILYKRYRWFQRGAFILALSGGEFVMVAYILLWMGFFDITYNILVGNKPMQLEEAYTNVGVWDTFWRKHPTLYKIAIPAFIVLGFYLYFNPLDFYSFT